MPPRINGPNFAGYKVIPVTEGHQLFSHVKSFPDVVEGKKVSWAMTATKNPDIFYPTRVYDAMPAQIRGVGKFKRVAEHEYEPLF